MAGRLRRSDPNRPGWTRRRAGRGFAYLDEQGRRLDAQDAQRCRSLAIPPAWTEVWICPWPNGHLQAVGTDAAGRRQYLYHPLWRQRRDEAKFARVLQVGATLPAARAVVAEHLALPGMPRERALAAGFRILDLAGVRIGSEQYARERGTVGIATIARGHATVRGSTVRLRFPGKSGREHDIELTDPALAAAVRELRRRRTGGPELLAWREASGWVDLTSADLNDYIRQVTGWEATAKDFRTWAATVRALAHLAGCEPARSTAARTRQVAAAMRAVAEHLGNTPAVARASYVDPRLADRHLAGALRRAIGADLPAPDDVAGWERVLLEVLG